MTSPNMPSTIVNIKVETGRAGLFYATSPELKGLLVAEPTEEALYAAIPRAIEELYDACGVQVMVTPAQGGADNMKPWVATPVKLAEAALAAAHARDALR